MIQRDLLYIYTSERLPNMNFCQTLKKKKNKEHLKVQFPWIYGFHMFPWAKKWHTSWSSWSLPSMVLSKVRSLRDSFDPSPVHISWLTGFKQQILKTELDIDTRLLWPTYQKKDMRFEPCPITNFFLSLLNPRKKARKWMSLQQCAPWFSHLPIMIQGALYDTNSNNALF